MQPISGNQRPDLLTSLMNMSLVLRLPREMHLCRSSSKVSRLPTFLKLLQNHHVLLTFGKVQNPLPLPHETASERPKVVLDRHFFNTFDLDMCFAPQRRALFQHLNFQKCSENGVRYILTWKSDLRRNCAFFRHLNFQKCTENGVFCTF